MARPDQANARRRYNSHIMPTSTDLRPLTNEQEVLLRHDLTLVEERLQDIGILMRVCYGEESQAVARADETSAALQRLKWELERTKLRKQAAGAT
jgi:Trm5-related predicted tRNA methylase